MEEIWEILIEEEEEEAVESLEVEATLTEKEQIEEDPVGAILTAIEVILVGILDQGKCTKLLVQNAE